MRRFLPLIALAACAEFPALDARVGPADVPPPPLAPLAPVLAAADALPAAGGFEAGLAAEAEALAARAGGIAAPAASGDDARLAALQARADALRGAVLTDEEAGRLASEVAAP